MQFGGIQSVRKRNGPGISSLEQIEGIKEPGERHSGKEIREFRITEFWVVK